MNKSDENPIRLDQFLKLVGAASTGGHAKLLIQSDQVQVNGTTENRRRKQLSTTDQVCVDGEIFLVNDFVKSSTNDESA